MPVVSYHLRKAKLTWMSNSGSREAKQTCFRDLFGDGKEAGEGCFWVNIDGAGGGAHTFFFFCTSVSIFFPRRLASNCSLKIISQRNLSFRESVLVQHSDRE